MRRKRIVPLGRLFVGKGFFRLVAENLRATFHHAVGAKRAGNWNY
jgi:hypothetical protein